MSRPIINGPDKVTSSAERLDNFPCAGFRLGRIFRARIIQWQKRLPGREEWTDIEGLRRDTYTVKSVTSDLNGCDVPLRGNVLHQSRQRRFRSTGDAATLTVGNTAGNRRFDGIRVLPEGSGTQEKPYIGQK